MVMNCNAITKYAAEMQTVDETTWGHAGYGESGSGLTGRLMNKKVNKGGQTTIMTDTHRFRPRCYIHRHKMHLPRDGMTRRGTIELHHLLSEVGEMVIDNDDEENPSSGSTTSTISSSAASSALSKKESSENKKKKKKKIFRNKPVVCADNFFFDDKLLNWIGENGYGCIGTCARNVLPKDIDKRYLHSVKHTSGCKISKVARFTHPIVAVKETNGYQRVHVSFQSTNSTNITTVNCLNECRLFIEMRERGKGVNKRRWGIEMNDSRRLYLSSYFRIDVVDHLLKNAAIFYRIWKYWHAPKNHALAMVLVLVHDLYLECAEGKINSEWFVPQAKRIDFFTFRHLLSKQMLTYDPKRERYPGDDKMRETTKIAKASRSGAAGGGGKKKLARVSASQLRDAKRKRLCGDLQVLCKHTSSIVRNKHGTVCAWCGEGGAYTHCAECSEAAGKKISLHYNCRLGPGKGLSCFYHYHDASMFGLGKNDSSQLLNKPKWEWKSPTKKEIKENKEHIKQLSKR